MHRYIGLDAHSQTCTLAVMGPTGKRLKEQVLETNSRLLIEFVKSIAGERHICLEEGTQSEWLYELLRPHADEIVVVQPRDRAGQKSDSIDAWELAEEMRRGPKRPVFKAPGVFGGLRAAVRAHQVLVADSVRAKNRLKAIFRARGVQTLGKEIYDAEERAAWIEVLPSHRRELARLLGETLDAIASKHGEAEAWLREEASRCAEVKLLATAPGIGLIRAAQIVACVVSPNRFRTRQQFWSYCGLGIVTRSSSDWTWNGNQKVRRKTMQHRGLNYRRVPMLKMVFKGAAITIETMTTHPLYADHQRMLAAGMKPALARVTMARKIAAIILAMWKNKEEYDSEKHRSKSRAA